MVNINYFRHKFFEWKREIFEYKYYILLSIIILVFANIIDYFSGIYVTNKISVQEVPDLILDHFGPYDLSFLFVWGFIFILLLMLFYTLFFKVKKIHTVVIQFSVLTVTRAIFILFTHLQTRTDAIPKHFPGLLNTLSFQNDLFFSGHVATPFLGFLLFKGDKIRYVFLIMSIIMAVTVLAMHQHYSIDVFAAYFIAYSSYKIVNFFSNKIKLIKER
jgi:hypothetical protein